MKPTTSRPSADGSKIQNMDSEALVLQLRYSAWATRRVLDSATALSAEELSRGLGNSYGGLRGTLEHIYQADEIGRAHV